LNALPADLAELTCSFHTRPGVSPAAVDEFAAALDGVRLPPDYLDFMCYSNKDNHERRRQRLR
jgi:hypothetical protein